MQHLVIRYNQVVLSQRPIFADMKKRGVHAQIRLNSAAMIKRRIRSLTCPPGYSLDLLLPVPSRLFSDQSLMIEGENRQFSQHTAIL